MKIKILAILMIFVMVFTLFACAKDDSKINDSGGVEDNKSTDDKTPGVAETTELKNPIPEGVQFNG